MSRVYQKQPAPTTRRAPGAPPPVRPSNPTTTSSTNRGPRAVTRGGVVRPPVSRQPKPDDPLVHENNRRPIQERTTHVGDGFHMITPLTEKREQIRRQAETEQREYEAHLERTRLRDIHEVHRLGGGGLSEEEVRRRQAEQYRRDKYARTEKAHQDQMHKKEEEEKALQAKKQAARLQSIENEKRERNNRVPSNGDSTNSGASGWTNEAREEDRRQTMDRFFNQFTQQCATAAASSDDDEQLQTSSESDKLSILRSALPHVDSDTLERYLEIYNGNVDAIVDELSNLW